MKSWQIHFAWAIVTAVACAITGRVASRREPEASPPPTPAVPRAEARSASAVSPAVPSGAGSDSVPLSAVIAAQASKPALEGSPVERMRALIKSSFDWQAFRDATRDLTDRETKMMLAKEALAGRNHQAIYWALMLLGDLKGRDSAEILEGVLKAHPADDVGSVAAGSLGTIGDPGSMAALNEATQSKNRSVQISSADSLKKMGYAAPAEALMSRFVREFESPDGSIRRTAVESMGELDAPAALPSLMRALKDVNGDVRLAAIQAIQSVGGLNLLEILGPLLNDPNPEVALQVKELVEDLRKLEK